MMKRHVFIVLAMLFFKQMGFTQSTGTFTDARDGQTYKTISFQESTTGKTVIWMAQNLNYKVDGSYAYENKENNRNELGLLYTWEAAKKACPSGWHLPTDNEWATLVHQFGGMDMAGEALKSVKSWNEDGNGNNSSGFDALAGGHRRPDGTYVAQGFLGIFWTSSISSSVDKAWAWNFHYGGPPSSNKQNLKKAFRWDNDVAGGYSVRLVRD